MPWCDLVTERVTTTAASGPRRRHRQGLDLAHYIGVDYLSNAGDAG